MAALRKSGESDTGFEESEEMMTCFYFPSSPPSFFPQYLPASPPLQSSPSSSYSGCLGEVKTRENKEENGARIAIPLEDILQTKAMRLIDAAKHLKVSKPKLKTASWDYGIERWPPRQKQELIRQSYPNKTSVIVDEEGISQLNYDTLPSDQPLAATVDTNSGVVIKIHPPQFFSKAQQENPDEDFDNYEVEVVGMGVEGTREGEMEEDEDFGNYEVEAVGMGVEGTGEGEMEEGQLNFGCLGKGKSNVETPGGDRGNKKTNGVKIDISLEDILQAERMYLEETGKQMILENAAKKFKVSRSTLKRVCRKYGILSWPPSKGNEHISQSRPKESLAVVDQEGVQQLNCDIPPFDQAWAAIVDTNSVVLKARWVDDIILKIHLPKPWKMADLGRQVEKRLKLESGTYYIRYKDEENELITILCDEDLQEYISSSRPLDTSSIEVFLVPKLPINYPLTVIKHFPF